VPQNFRAFARGISTSFIAPFILLLTLFGSAAQAQTSSAVANGVQWLNGQVQNDGSLQNEAQSIATPMQNRAEAAQALQLLSTLPASLPTNVNAIAESNTQYLARKIIVSSLAHADVSALLPILTQRQNPDGGYGGSIAYASDSINTAWAVLALSQTSSSNTPAASLARSYLSSQIGIDGGVFDSTQFSRVFDNAIVLMALETTPDSSNASAISSLTSWLQLQQGGDGSWLANTFLTAYALMAVGPVSSDNTLTGNAASYLLGRQAADGSWNEDPYLTAIVLRAISIHPLASAGVTAVQGQVIDNVSNAPLGGVSVTVTGNAATTTTDNNGNFNLTGLSAGTYTVGFAVTGYGGVTRSVTVAGGQSTNIGTVAMGQLGTAAIVRGQIVAAGSGAPLAGVTVTLSGATTASAVTDANGRYVITGATPGSVTISASLAGYQTATATTTLVAGQTIAFAPGLYASGQTAPGGVQYGGTVVSAGTAAPLVGATLQFTGAATSTATTNAGGQFSVTLSPGSYSVTFSQNGYKSVTQNIVGAAGTSINAGIVNLTPVLGASTITGQVLNASNQAVAGATVQIVGTSQVATTASDGSYTLSNVVGTSVSVRASATGFDSQTINLQLPQPANVVQNFTLAAQSAGSLTIGTLNVTPANVGSNTNVTVATTISNTGSAVASAIVQLQILDGSGKLIGVGAAYDSNGNLVGQISLLGGQSSILNLVWNSAQFAPGNYRLVVRLVQVGSLVRTTPQGITLAESAASVAVTGQAHFSGTVSANPPVLQAGLNTPVQFSATLQNDGNIALTAQTLTLSVVNTADNSVPFSETANSVLSPVSGTQAVTFGSWTPTTGGNYNLVVTAADPTIGKLTGTLYIGDAGSAIYTVSKQVVPTGTQTVRGKIQVLGQDVASGTISDPLAPIIKAAIQKSVTYDDTTTTAWTAQHQCMSCHIHTQALVGGDSNRKITTFDAEQRNNILYSILGHQRASGAFYDEVSYFDYVSLRNTSTMLSMWALSSWHDQNAVAAAQMRGADYLVTQQQADGHWDFAYPWLARWTSPTDHTALNIKSLIGLINTLPSVPADALKIYQTSIYPPGGTDVSSGALVQDQAGNLYTSSFNQNAVRQIKPDGTIGLQWNVNGPICMLVDKAGTGILVTTGSGLMHLTLDGNVTQLNNFGDLDYLQYAPDGTLYGGSYPSSTLYKIDNAWQVSLFVPGGVVYQPGTFAFDSAGNMIVTSNNNVVYQVAKDGTATQIKSLYGIVSLPRIVMPYGQGWLIGATDGVYSFDAQWNLLAKLSDQRADSIVVAPNGNLLYAGYTFPSIKQITVGTEDASAAIARYTASVDLATQWLMAQNLSDNVAMSHQLIGLGEAAKFYANDASRHAAIEAKMAALAAVFRSNQNSDGSWGTSAGAVGDAFVTAHVGYALGYLNPSPTDPVIRSAVQWLLSVQQLDGSWNSAGGIFTTNVAATTWVSIWLPQALAVIGGIDTDLSVTFPSNVTMSNPDTAPASVTPNSDGTSTALWHLTGVTAAGQTVNYDLTLQNMAPNEVRAVSTDAHLTFNNSFTNGTVNSPISIPQVTASAFLSLGVTTDKQSYPANALANITGQVTNTAANLSSGSVKFDIYAADNTLVASLGSMPFNQLAANASTNLGMTWNTGNTAPAAGYYVLATLFDSTGAVVGTARSAFAITSTSGTGANTQASVTLAADKQTYQPGDSVNLSDRLTNLTTNTALNNLSVVTSVLSPSGTSVFSKTETLAQLQAAALKNYAYSLPLGNAAAGVYTASVVVTAADGSTVAQANASFTVASSSASGSGLTGSISVATQQVQIGNPLALSFSATNGGNSALTGVPLTVSILDPVSQKVIASYPTTQTLAIGASYGGSDTWTAAGTVGNTYVAVLAATVGGNAITLAQTNFTLTAPPIKLAITQALWNGNRVLALTACNDSGTTTATSTTTAATCSAKRYAAIDAALTSLGVPHLITTNAAAFTQAMRSGLYNTLWIAGDQSLVGDTLTGEIDEAVYYGDTLIVDGAPSQCNATFDTFGGITARTSVASNPNVTLNGPFYATAQTLPTVGTAQSFTVTGAAQVQGTFAVSKSGSTQNVAAIVSNTVGAGRTLIAGFDLGATLAAQTAQSTPAITWNAALGATLNALTPLATASLTPGQVLPVQTVVANQGVATTVDTQMTLATGAQYLGATPTATLNAGGNVADWGYSLAVAQSEALDISMRAPGSGGSYNLQTVVGTVAGGAVTPTSTPYGNPLAFPFTVTPAATHAANAIAALQALTLTVKADQTLRTSLIANINQAMGNFNLNTYTGYGTAIGETVGVSGSLSASVSGFSTAAASANSSAINGIRAEVDRILQEAQWRWTLTQPEVSSTLNLDKTSCQPSDTVTLSETVTNITTSTTLTKLQVATTITGPGGTVVFTKTESLAQLAVGARQPYSYPVALANDAPGAYQVSMIVTDANGNTLAQSSGQFSVASTATTGAGLSGTVQVSPQQVPLGSAAVITIGALDQGNSALTALPLTLAIVNSATQKTVAQFPYSATLAIGGSYTASSSWTATGTAGTAYQAVLNATLGPLNLQLAQAPFTVIAPPVQLSVTQNQAAWQNLLIYSACKRATDGLLGQCGATALPVDNPVTLAACDSGRAAMIEQTLAGLGVSHSIVTDASTFLAKLRSGQYNGYWISNGATVLQEPVASELRAAVTRGGGLIVDGLDAGVNPALASCAGVAFKAPFAAASEPLSITGKLYNPGNFTITAAPAQLSGNAGTTVQATLGSGSTAGAGIVDSVYGNGKTLAFGFDWATTLNTQASNKAWPAIAQASMNYVEPAAASGSQFIAGDSIMLATAVQNTGQAANIQVVQTLPAGATVASTSPAAQVSGNSVTWTATLAQGATQVFAIRLQVPIKSGSYALPTNVNVVSNGKATPYQSENFAFTVQGAADLMTQLITAVQTHNTGSAQQQAVAAAVLAQLGTAQAALSASHSQDEVLRLLLSAQSRLAAIDSGGTLEPLLANLIAAVERQTAP